MRNIFNLSIAGLALLAVACDDPSVEIVEQNNSYKLDQNAIHVDMPERFGHNTSNLIRNEGGTEAVLYASEIEGEIQIPVTEIPLVFKLKRNLKQATRFVFSPDEELMKLYTGVKEGFKPFLENAFSGMEFTIPPGITDYRTTIRLQEGITGLNQKPGFLSSYRLKPLSGGDADIKVSEASEALYIKLRFSSLKNEENVSLAESIEDDWNQIPSSQVTPASDYQAGRLSYILDGQKDYWWTSNWWIPGGGAETLELGFAKQKVAGVVFYTNSQQQKVIRSVRVSVSEDGGATYFNQGVVQPERAMVVYIAFDEPVEINKIKFSNFESWNAMAPYIDIHEVEVYTVE